MTAYGPPVSPITAARAYLRAELAARGNPLPVGVDPPAQASGEVPHALLSRPGSNRRNLFTVDYMLRVQVYDHQLLACERNADLLWSLMGAATHTRITLPSGEAVWIDAATQAQPGGPGEFEDGRTAMHAMQFATFWTISLKPI